MGGGFGNLITGCQVLGLELCCRETGTGPWNPWCSCTWELLGTNGGWDKGDGLVGKLECKCIWEFPVTYIACDIGGWFIANLWLK